MAQFLQPTRLKVLGWRSRVRAYALAYLPRAAWRLLPGTSASFGPPRQWKNWTIYKKTHEVGWSVAFDAAEGEFPRPFWPPGDTSPFKWGKHYAWPAQGVARLSNARVVTANGWCVAPEDVFLGDFCFGGNNRNSRVYHLTFHNKPRWLKGVTLNLCSAHSAINFCHWLLDAVGRLELFERCGFNYDAVDQILLPKFPGPTAVWVLQQLKLPPDKLIHPSDKDQFHCETLLQPSYPGTPATYSPWVVDFYRRHFPAERREPTRLVYFQRKGKRGLTNAAEVEEELNRWGFEAFDPAGQIDLSTKFADVTHIVGVHGAGLANLVFCRPGTRVLELIPSDTPWRFYYTLCSGGQMPYGVVIGKSLRERRSTIEPPTNAPFKVPLDELREAISALLSRSGAQDVPDVNPQEPRV